MNTNEELTRASSARKMPERSASPSWERKTQKRTAGLKERGVLEASKEVVLKNCWPVEVGSIDLTYDALDTVVEFPVTIAYDYFEVIS